MDSAWIDRLLDLGLDVDAAAWQVRDALGTSQYAIEETYGCGNVNDLDGNGSGRGDFEYGQHGASYGDGDLYGEGDGSGGSYDNMLRGSELHTVLGRSQW